MGTVYKAVCADNTKDESALSARDCAAIKAVSIARIRRLGIVKYIQTEIAIMRRLNHPNIIRIHRTMLSPRHLYIAMEYCHEDLKTRITNEGAPGSAVSKRYFRDILKGLEHCHSHNVAWRDAKPENLLISDTDTLKICDFGFSRALLRVPGSGSTKYERCTSLVGTLDYVAPEVLVEEDGGYDAILADIWSIGCVLLVMLTGKLPGHISIYEDSDAELVELSEDSSLFENFEKVHEIKDFDIDIEPSSIPQIFDSRYFANLSEDEKDVVKSMINRVPEERPSLGAILNFPWVRLA